MEGMISDIFAYLLGLGQSILGVLLFAPAVYDAARQNDIPFSIALVIALLSGISTLLGQSVILFVNRVRPPRFIASILLNGAVYTANLFIWAVTTFIAGRVIAGVAIPLGDAIRITSLTAAPMIFGVLILIPHFGPLIGHLLSVWGFLIALQSVSILYQVGFWPTLIIIGSGWLLTLLISKTIGKPITAIMQRLRRWVAGTDLDETGNAIRTTISRTLNADSAEARELGLAKSKGGRRSA